MTGILIRPSGHTRLYIAISEGYTEALLALLAEDGMPAELERMIKYFFTDTLPTGMVKFKAVQALIPRYAAVVNTMRHVVATGRIPLSAALFTQLQTTAGDPINTLDGYRTRRAEQLKMCANTKVALKLLVHFLSDLHLVLPNRLKGQFTQMRWLQVLVLLLKPMPARRLGRRTSYDVCRMAIQPAK